MASTKHNRNAPKGSAPISAHPAFPLVVALWFAALLGLGSLILPVMLIEKLVTVTGIADLVPAAAPPLGFTARGAIALGGMVVGAVLGLFAARKIARPAAETPRRRSIKGEQSARRQPLHAHEDLGSASFDSVAGFAATRRRALAGEEEVRASDFLVTAPLPGKRHEHGFAYAASARDEPLELAEFTEDQELDQHSAASEEEVAMSQMQVFSPIHARPVSGDALPFSPPSMAHRPAPIEVPDEIEVATFEEEVMVELEQPAEPQQFFVPVEPQVEAPEIAEVVAMPDEQAAEPTHEHGAEIGLVQLVQKLGATLEKHREWSAQRAELQPDGPRFPHAVVVQDFAEDDFEAVNPAEAAQAMAAFFSAPEPVAEPSEETPAPTERQEFVPVPAAKPDVARQLRPFAGLDRVEDADDDEELENIAASFSLPLGRAAAPVRAEPEAAFEDAALEDTAVEDSAPEEHAEGEAYSSLLVMKNPFRDHRPEFVRIEEPEPEAGAPQPAVVFPHEVLASRMFDRPGGPLLAAATAEAPTSARAAGSNDDNDRVLREALMNLQRIGKN